MLPCIRFLSQCKNRHSSKSVHVLKVQTCSLSLNFVRFIIICKMFLAHLFNLLSYGPMEPGVTETKWFWVSCSLLLMLSSFAQKLLWLSSSLGEVVCRAQRAGFPGRLNAWSVFGEAVMKESPEPLGIPLILQSRGWETEMVDVRELQTCCRVTLPRREQCGQCCYHLCVHQFKVAFGTFPW